MVSHGDDAVAAWVRASCARQGVPEKVEDPGAIRAVVGLLGPPRRARVGRRGQGRSDSGHAPPEEP